MATVIVPGIKRSSFSLGVEHDREVCLKITGNAEMEMLPVLGPFLTQLHDQVLSQRERLVVVDLRELYFMNSSCFKVMITWIAGIKKLDSTAAYRVQFRANAKLHWQRRNLEAIREFAPTVVDVAAS